MRFFTAYSIKKLFPALIGSFTLDKIGEICEEISTYYKSDERRMHKSKIEPILKMIKLYWYEAALMYNYVYLKLIINNPEILVFIRLFHPSILNKGVCDMKFNSIFVKKWSYARQQVDNIAKQQSLMDPEELLSLINKAAPFTFDGVEDTIDFTNKCSNYDCVKYSLKEHHCDACFYLYCSANCMSDDKKYHDIKCGNFKEAKSNILIKTCVIYKVTTYINGEKKTGKCMLTKDEDQVFEIGKDGYPIKDDKINNLIEPMFDGESRSIFLIKSTGSLFSRAN